MGYIFKPSTTLTNEVGDAVRDLRCDCPDVNVSTFFEFAVDCTLDAYRKDRSAFIGRLRTYITRQRASKLSCDTDE